MADEFETGEKIDAMVSLYIECRDWVKAQEVAHKDKIAAKKAAMQQIEGILQTFLDKTGQIRGACKTGTFYSTTKYSASIKDKQEFKRHVIGTENWDLLDFKCNVQAARDFEKENGAPLPGVAINAIAKVGVRRPGAAENEDE
jgi:hypothetical protein